VKLIKVALKVGWEKGWMDGERGVVWAARFCGPCECLGVLLLVSQRMLESGIAGGWVVYSWYGRLVSRC
jgi:hypothetical protein